MNGLRSCGSSAGAGRQTLSAQRCATVQALPTTGTPMHLRPITLITPLFIALVAILPAPCVSHAAAASNWRAGWGLATNARAPAEPAVAAAPLLRLQAMAGHWQARLDNPYHGPLQVTLRAADDRPLPGLPLATVLPANASITVGPLPPPEPGQALDLRLRAVPGDTAAQPQDVAYALPFADAAVRVSQGPQGWHSHRDPGNRDAIDFALAEGTPVLAARAGVVMQVRDGFAAGSSTPGQDIERVNLVRVLHADGSMAVYAHLLAGAMRVRAGQQVVAGQWLGRSGNSGYSAGPHLHFVVQANRGLQLQSVPVRIVTAAGELRLARDHGDAPHGSGTGPAQAR